MEKEENHLNNITPPVQFKAGDVFFNKYIKAVYMIDSITEEKGFMQKALVENLDKEEGERGKFFFAFFKNGDPPNDWEFVSVDG